MSVKFIQRGDSIEPLFRITSKKIRSEMKDFKLRVGLAVHNAIVGDRIVEIKIGNFRMVVNGHYPGYAERVISMFKTSQW